MKSNQMYIWMKDLFPLNESILGEGLEITKLFQENKSRI